MSGAQDFEKSSFTDVSDASQLSLLNAQIAYARERSRYYCTALRDVTAISALSELSALPFLTSETLTAQGTALCCVSAGEIARVVSLRSSGTVGAPKRLFFSENDLECTIGFFREGMQWMSAAGDRVGIFFPGSSPDGLCDLLSRALSSFGAVPIVYGGASDIGETAKRMKEMQPDVLVGMPWQMRAFSIALPDMRPKAVLLSADFVPEALRMLLKQRWRCPVLTHYGLTESGYGFAVQRTEDDGMYYRRSDYLAEVVDPCSGALLPFGQEGELVITSLRREAMPLIRYRTGDRAVMTDEKKIARIPGRFGNADEFYDLQETLAPLPWLVDYAIAENTLTAHVTADAPQDCIGRLSRLTGKGNILCKQDYALMSRGKRA